MNGVEIRKPLEEARLNRERLFGEIENLRAREQVDGPSDGLAERMANLNRGVEKADNRIQELEAEFGRDLLDGMRSGRYVAEDGAARAPERRDEPREPRNEVRDQALRTIERVSDQMDDAAAERAERLVRRDDVRGTMGRYLTAAGAEAYRSAFWKIAADPTHGHLRFSAEEVEAVRAVSAIQAERNMNITTGSAGGFALPVTIDPSIMLSSAGALNPVRRIARSISVEANGWRGVSSDGVTVSYSAEAAAMVDGSPVLAQPLIKCQRWTAFVPYSWELAGDWQGLETELVRLIADGRDVNDSTAFYSGGGTAANPPNGVLHDLAIGGTAYSLLTTGTAALAAGDIWALKEAVPARFAAKGSARARTRPGDVPRVRGCDRGHRSLSRLPAAITCVLRERVATLAPFCRGRGSQRRLVLSGIFAATGGRLARSPRSARRPGHRSSTSRHRRAAGTGQPSTKARRGRSLPPRPLPAYGRARLRPPCDDRTASDERRRADRADRARSGTAG
jgi:HK97 family phage major capsid protein